MKIATKAMMAGIAACTFAAPAFAYTINGTVPPYGQWTSVKLQPPPKPAILKLTFSPTIVNPSFAFSINFCISPSPRSCQAMMIVPPGQQAILPLYSSNFPTNSIWLQNGTHTALPYTLDVDTITP
jgi:hypothetical protein